MPPNDEVRAALNTSVGSSQEKTHSSGTLRESSRLAARSGLSGGVGSPRSTHSSTSISTNADIGRKYDLVMRGFKLLEATCKDLKHRLADSEQKLRSREQAYVALEGKAQSDETSYTEQVLKLEDQIRSYETAYTELVSKVREKVQADEIAHAGEVSRLEERLQASSCANSQLAEKLEQCESALKDRESDLNSLSETIQRSVTCGICQSIPTQPCSTDCRHVFCAMCLLSWWQTKQETSCPTCRTVSESPPVRDSLHGFIALARAQAGEADESDTFDSDIFDAFFSPKGLKSKAHGSRSTTPIEIL